ncbi:hypothetical protein CTEN210_09456 [Chaetoceros tenuissimus]|uniref:Nudix hydrolase domain-containing protein n=1 Tax=Chaetoceros tenuissimus TaxID=426638 RepID=A0AAD3CXV1_9STRA|nr:hypothetical protein CTEN210_09456 [Chaetoceros tenuissimus]
MKTPYLPPRIFLENASNRVISPAIFGQSMFDIVCKSGEDQGHSNTSIHRHYEKYFVNLREDVDASGNCHVVLGHTISRSSENTNNWNIPFARAIENKILNSTKCPAVYLDEEKYYNDHDRHKPYVTLGAVAMIVDTSNKILLTRRPKEMRSFPGAWVLPGGGVDANESFLDGSAREVEEETGLKVDSIEPIALWESCFPTDGIECIENGIGLKGHYLVVFCRCKMKDNSEDGPVKLKLQEEEIDRAVWLGSNDYSSCNTEVAMLDAICLDGNKNQQISMMELCGIYPQGDSLTGIAQGHLFMIEEYFSRRSFL